MTTHTGSTAALLAETMRTALLLADLHVADLLRGEATPELDAWGHTWYDTRPLLSEHEHGPVSRDMHAQALAYGRFRGLTLQHPRKPHLVRLLRCA